MKYNTTHIIRVYIFTNVVHILYQDSPCDPCAVHCCFHWCAVCQEHREMKLHLAESVEDTMTSPPRVQEMNTIEKDESISSSSSYSSSTRQDSEDSKNMELQVVER